MDSSQARTFLAITLSMLIIILWQMYLTKKYPPKVYDAGYADAEVITDKEDLSASKNEAAPISSQSQSQEEAKGEYFEEETAVLKSEYYEALFTNRGGALKRFELKKYNLAHSPDKKVDLVSENRSSLLIHFKSGSIRLKGDERYEFVEKSDNKIVFEHKDRSGVTIRKEFIKTGSYELLLKVSVLNNSNSELLFKPSLVLYDFALKGGLSKKDLNSGLQEYYYPLCLANNSLLDGIDLKKGSISLSQEGSIGFLASTSRYFISAVLPVDQKIAMCRFESNDQYEFTAELIYPEIKVESQKEGSFSYRIYMGPKGYSLLKKIGNDLERAVDFGWLAILCIPLLYLLNWFNLFVHNYGVSIILLTVVVKLISIPFTQKSMKSMQELQKLKPKIDELQKKYKDNKEKLNEEIMRLYREHGVSPFGGCLPMLLQMPIWFALYRMLSNSVELYQAVFIPGWINDLSSKDPYYILPILLGVGTFLQQKLTPSTMDSAQTKVMLYFMPAFLTFIMITLPSGLTLYIFVSSLLSIIHQVYMNRRGRKITIQPKSTREEGQ